MSKRSERKEEHLALAQMFFNKEKQNYFDQVHLLRPALPETKVNLNSIKTTMFKKKVSAPFFINAMTGGSKKSFEINKSLGYVANKANIAMALGSSSILVNEPDQLASFSIARDENPDGVLIININPLTPAKDAKTIANELQADAVQIHVNTVQELAMPEGERDYRWLNNMKELQNAIDVPIIVKEVGFGFDQGSIKLLKENGFNLIDVAGAGGTNFAQIENSRNSNDLSYLEDLGLPTPVTALIAKKTGIDYIVSGGVRNPLDILKGLALGGKYVGISNVLLQKLLDQGQEGLLEFVQEWKKELAGLMAIFACSNLKNVQEIQIYYDLYLKSILDQLNI